MPICRWVNIDFSVQEWVNLESKVFARVISKSAATIEYLIYYDDGADPRISV